MANYTTGAQRYNNRMDKVWESAIASLQKYCEHAEYYERDNYLEKGMFCTKCGKKRN